MVGIPSLIYFILIGFKVVDAVSKWLDKEPEEEEAEVEEQVAPPVAVGLETDSFVIELEQTNPQVGQGLLVNPQLLAPQ